MDSSWSETTLDIKVGDKQIACIMTTPHTANGYAVILTHGAGGDMNFRHLVSLAHSLGQSGFHCLRFTCKGLNIKYRTKVYKAILEHLHECREYELKGYILAGRSMGSRAAVGVANEVVGTSMEGNVLGVVCLAYPLHPPKDVTNLRSEPLTHLQCPSLFVSGTKDEMCRKDLMEEWSKKIPAPTETLWLEGANHGFSARGISESETLAGVCVKVAAWCTKITHTEASCPSLHTDRSDVKVDRSANTGKRKISKSNGSKEEGKRARKRKK